MVRLSSRAVFPDAVELPTLRVALGERFADKLWALPEAQALVQKAKETVFINGIKCNTLDPLYYGIYNLQDCMYLASATDNFNKIQDNPNNSVILKQYYQGKVQSYTALTKDTYSAWHINEAVDEQYGAIRLSPAARDYIAFEKSVVTNDADKPIYFALANYPCYRLWPEMCEYLIQELAGTPTVYQTWIDYNKDFRSAEKLANLLESQCSDFEWERAKEVFLEALNFEVKFFNEFMNDF
ncbi:hypothetical protein VOLCADRAFT_109657 [Volvox carteri f. nagariensis]|uniref:Thiaminase-2/PQQC domain-containing protein n=1 Tax=Volvox carteri f. nagariensis TaxID=3068 RepID=D8TNA3_VOLCA|nr:uncharacterized protein VOLCADRAFT_109657 [Volvox carteri f. nagariensis]EFJ50955.1 hypothetical protein VOLCADRAFT_109657 [Volvox carteri f. nagariensis]|eukprot:XP_002947967.1 hypothetical protein VOLCADRAFT_109657 [Volvox carteri f. nagariensis]